MTDRRDPFRALDQLEPPDVWQRARRLGPKEPAPEPSPSGARRAGVVALALVLTVATTGLVVRAFRPASEGPPASSVPSVSSPLTSSGLVADGTLRCTVELPVNPLVPGEPTGVVFTVENVTDATVQVRLSANGYAGWLVFAGGGTEFQDSQRLRAGLGGPLPDEMALAPGESVDIGAMDTAVLWAGPLDVTPHCVDRALPAVQMEVEAPGAPADPDASIAQAVSALGDAFDGCVPTTSGTWVTGTFGAAEGTIDARCGAYVIERDGFDVVALAAVSPPDAPELDLAQLPDRIEAVPNLSFPNGTSVRVSWWVLVVTRDSTSCATHRAIWMGPDSYSISGSVCRGV